MRDHTPDELFDSDRPGWVAGEIICEVCGTFFVAVFHVRTEGGQVECLYCHQSNPIANAKIIHNE